jgi:uncharacterized protein YdaU (DUF1376 family)
MSDKNPAVLWYPSDYLVGTMGMTWEEKGRYVELLNLQHQKGHLDINRLMPDCPKEVLAKFVQDENGLWYNIRMEEEQIKRRKYSESRRNNRMGKTSEQADAQQKREKIEGKLEQMRSLAQANMRDREDTLWQND